MKAWNELTRAEQLACEYYDFYKDVHGIRPRWIYTEGGVCAYSEQELEEMLDRLAAEAKEVFAEETRIERENIKKFEQTVAALCESMHKPRKTIVRWMFDGSDSNGDWDYYCWNLGVPYGYFKEFYEEAA